MSNPSRFLRHFFLLLALCLAVSTQAHAKRGFMLINTGDELFEVAAFPEDVIQKIPRASQAKVGYKCDHFGIFWADVWTWNCKLVAVLDENSYADLPDEISSRLSTDPQFALGKAKRGFWNHYAFWVIVLGICGFFAYAAFSKKKDEEPADMAAA